MQIQAVKKEELWKSWNTQSEDDNSRPYQAQIEITSLGWEYGATPEFLYGTTHWASQEGWAKHLIECEGFTQFRIYKGEEKVFNDVLVVWAEPKALTLLTAYFTWGDSTKVGVASPTLPSGYHVILTEEYLSDCGDKLILNFIAPQ